MRVSKSIFSWVFHWMTIVMLSKRCIIHLFKNIYIFLYLFQDYLWLWIFDWLVVPVGDWIGSLRSFAIRNIVRFIIIFFLDILTDFFGINSHTHVGDTIDYAVRTDRMSLLLFLLPFWFVYITTLIIYRMVMDNWAHFLLNLCYYNGSLNLNSQFKDITKYLANYIAINCFFLCSVLKNK